MQIRPLANGVYQLTVNRGELEELDLGLLLNQIDADQRAERPVPDFWRGTPESWRHIVLERARHIQRMRDTIREALVMIKTDTF